MQRLVRRLAPLGQRHRLVGLRRLHRAPEQGAHQAASPSRPTRGTAPSRPQRLPPGPLPPGTPSRPRSQDKALRIKTLRVKQRAAPMDVTLLHAEEWAERLKSHNPLWLFFSWHPRPWALRLDPATLGFDLTAQMLCQTMMAHSLREWTRAHKAFNAVTPDVSGGRTTLLHLLRHYELAIQLLERRRISDYTCGCADRRRGPAAAAPPPAARPWPQPHRFVRAAAASRCGSSSPATLRPSGAGGATRLSPSSRRCTRGCGRRARATRRCSREPWSVEAGERWLEPQAGAWRGRGFPSNGEP